MLFPQHEKRCGNFLKGRFLLFGVFGKTIYCVDFFKKKITVAFRLIIYVFASIIGVT